MQLTGVRMSDPAIQRIHSIKDILEYLHEKPKPKKLAQALEVNKRLRELPNVQLMARRYTPIDQHQELGRWKIIVNELKERDLPITGHQPPSEVEEMAYVKDDVQKRARYQAGSTEDESMRNMLLAKARESEKERDQILRRLEA